MGIVGEERMAAYTAKAALTREATDAVNSLTATAEEITRTLGLHLRDGGRKTAAELLRRRELSIAQLSALWPTLAKFPKSVTRVVEAECFYARQLRQQHSDILLLRKSEHLRFPDSFDYHNVPRSSSPI